MRSRQFHVRSIREDLSENKKSFYKHYKRLDNQINRFQEYVAKVNQASDLEMLSLKMDEIDDQVVELKRQVSLKPE